MSRCAWVNYEHGIGKNEDIVLPLRNQSSLRDSGVESLVTDMS